MHTPAQIQTRKADASDPKPAADALYRLSYASTQTGPLSALDLISLLKQARQSNKQQNITGVLLHRDDSFLQVIEGEKQAVLNLFEVIKKDPRHKRVEVLSEDPIEEREFSDWQMGFLELDDVDVRLLPGFSNFLNETDSPRTLLKNLSHTERLMLLFKALS
jgi:hypothetical protein